MDDLIKGLKALFKLNQQMRDLMIDNNALITKLNASIDEQTEMMRVVHDQAVSYPTKKAG